MHVRTIPRLFVGAVLAVALAVPAAAADDADAPTLDEDLIAEVLELLEERYVDDDALTTENLSIGAIRGIVDALGDDGHTQYLTEEEYKVEQEILDGRVAGIGVVLDQRSSAPLIISVVDGSPADRAGVQAGDIIATVDGVETARLPLGELGTLVRGEPGTLVRLGLERPGDAELLDIGILRADVEVDPVAWAMAPGSDVAVIRIVQFSVGSGHLVRAAAEQAIEEGATGFVLDLRGNPGGLVNETLNAMSAFLDDGVAFLERGRDEDAIEVRVDPGRALDTEMPIVALVDYGTASAGEILAAGLRDNGRATIVGEQTFGTGTILNTIRLSDQSALRLGVREWLTPAGEGVFRVGVTPDEEVTLPLGSTRLSPPDFLTLTPIDFETSEDVPLRHAVRLAESSARS